MLSLNSPVGAVPKVGPKYKTLLKSMGIETVEDLLYHFPFRYDDYSVQKNIADLKEGDIVTVTGTLDKIDNIYTRYGKKLTLGKFSDETGEVKLVWFNQQYLKKTLEEGRKYYLSGKASVFSNKLSFVAPELEEIKEGSPINTRRMVAVYPETAGVSSKWLRSRNNDVISLPILKEFLPKECLTKFSYPEFHDSLLKIHFPSSNTDVEISRARFSFEELFMELLNVEKRKHEWAQNYTSGSLKLGKAEQSKLAGLKKTLLFKLTQDQEKALEQILEDMQKNHPMNRLLEGDVGTGKTIVALLASFVAHLNGFRTLYMAPTEILANQHYETFKKYLPDLKIELQTGATAKNNNTGADIIIGTHAIIFAKEKFENVGLVIIDEQQRFGVEQRGKIIELGTNGKVPHLLSMTATPIPRTLALTLYGDLAVSVLKTHPNKLRQITTKAIPENKRMEIYKWVKEKNEPTFIVCPLIEGSEALGFENIKAAQEEYFFLKKNVFTDVEVGLLHGKMTSKEKQEMINKFRSGAVKVLVSTPVIEVGMDIPDATVMVIESAERYGLANLHQLRGRVGRGEKEGFCFAIMSNNSRQAYARLKNLERIDNGIELAEVDLKIRGQGDVFGIMQHGFKKLRIADLSDLEMLEKAKLEAQEYYPKLNKYPELDKKLTERLGKYIPSN